MTSGNKGGGVLRKTSLILLTLVFLGGIVFAGLFNTGLSATNEMEFCTSCHSMKIPLEEYQESLHYKMRRVCAPPAPIAMYPSLLYLR
jgi:cytochrome c-type protein NapC